MGSADDLGVWERLDDVIMGGQSDSALQSRQRTEVQLRSAP